MRKRLIILAVLVVALLALVAPSALAQGYGYWWFDPGSGSWYWYDPYGWPNYGGGEGANMCGILPDATWYGQPC